MCRRFRGITRKPGTWWNARQRKKHLWWRWFLRFPWSKAGNYRLCAFTADSWKPGWMYTIQAERKKKKCRGFCGCTPTNGNGWIQLMRAVLSELSVWKIPLPVRPFVMQPHRFCWSRWNFTNRWFQYPWSPKPIMIRTNWIRCWKN